jgi:hypothetical protein
VGKAAKEHLGVSGGQLRVQDVMKIVPKVTEAQAVLLLEVMAEITDCARLEKGLITEELFITALMIVNIECLRCIVNMLKIPYHIKY